MKGRSRLGMLEMEGIDFFSFFFCMCVVFMYCVVILVCAGEHTFVYACRGQNMKTRHEVGCLRGALRTLFIKGGPSC